MPNMTWRLFIIGLGLVLFSWEGKSQVTLGEAAMVPRSDEIKPWPDFDAHGNGFSNLDIASTFNGGLYLHLFGLDGQSPCGPRVVRIILGFPQQTLTLGGLYVDGEYGPTMGGGYPDRVGDAAKSQPPGSGGFGSEVAGDAVIGDEYCFSMTAKQMTDLDTLVAPQTISATDYVIGNGQMHLWQDGYNASTSAPPPVRPGQSIPIGNITNDPARIAGTGASRTCGVLALGEGGAVTVTEDMTGGDPGAVFGIPSPGKSVIVITVWNDYGNSVRTPSFMYPGVGGDAPARQSVAGGGYFIVRTAKNTVTAFDIDGKVLLDYGNYLDVETLPPGIVALETGGVERSISTTGVARSAITVRGLDTEGKYHPCVVVLDIVSLWSARKRVIQVDNDLVDAPDFIDASAMDVAVGPNREIMVAWRHFPSQSPVARFFDLELQPITPTFWVSTKEATDVNTGDTTIKCSLQDEFGWVAWLSESFNPGLNCKGSQMQRDTVVRAFQNPVWVSAVTDWIDY